MFELIQRLSFLLVLCKVNKTAQLLNLQTDDFLHILNSLPTQIRLGNKS